jgi:hypothetical protein
MNLHSLKFFLFVSALAFSGSAFGDATLRFDRDEYSVLPGTQLTLNIHFDMDNETVDLDLASSPITSFGLQVLGRHIIAGAAAPELDHYPLLPSAKITVFPDSAQIRGESLQGVDYFGTFLGSVTLAIPDTVGSILRPRVQVLGGIISNGTVLLDSDLFTVNDTATVKIIPEPGIALYVASFIPVSIYRRVKYFRGHANACVHLSR